MKYVILYGYYGNWRILWMYAFPLDVHQKVSQLHLHQQPSIENALAGRDPPLPVVAVGNLIHEQASNVVKSLLKTHSKRLTNDQHRLILTKEDHTSALYLWAVLEELRLGGDFGLDGQVINQMIAAFPSTLEPLFNQVLERIEGEVDHEFWEYLRNLEFNSAEEPYYDSLKKANYFMMELAMLRNFWKTIEAQLD